MDMPDGLRSSATSERGWKKMGPETMPGTHSPKNRGIGKRECRRLGIPRIKATARAVSITRDDAALVICFNVSYTHGSRRPNRSP